jgi:hypothetical protein
MAAEIESLRGPLNRRSESQVRLSVFDDGEDFHSRGSRGSRNTSNFERGLLLRASYRASNFGARQSPSDKGDPMVTDPSRDSADLDLETALIGLTTDAVKKLAAYMGPQ